MGGLIIGSVAARWHLPDWPRDPKDFDVYTRDNLDQLPPWAFDRIEPFWHPELESFVPREGYRFASIPEQYTIKVSHSQWDLRNGTWLKHVEDAMLLKAAGATLEWDFYLALMRIWKAVHGPKRVNLTMDKESFFDDAVKRKYDHDSVHYSVAYGDRPLYEEVFDGNAEIAMDMNVIKALPFETQVRLYREEVYATALERWVIPRNYKCSPRWAYAQALKKTIVSLTKGWSSRFLIENYDTFRRPDFDYVKHHLSKAHLLIPLEGN